MRVPSIASLFPTVTGAYPKDLLELVDIISNGNSAEKEEIRDKVWFAYQFSKEHHQDQKRRSGRPYFEHVYAVAHSLAEWNMDVSTVIGGILHDTVEDTQATYKEIQELFGDEVANLVEGVTKLGELKFQSREEKQAENLMKMLLSMTKDIRVIIIKFADRIHNMGTIGHLPLIKQRRIAIETRDVYSPLAHRLGMFAIKSQLDDFVLKTLEPVAYKEINKRLKATKGYRRKFIKEIIKSINAELVKNGVDADIIWRLKSYYSIHGKIKKREKPLEEIYDILAIRIIVEDVSQCYIVLGVVHHFYAPVQERFKDFIATPKRNGYQSLHTTVVGPSGKMVEIQIRTKNMDETAEIGVAAHWKYKEGNKSGGELDRHVKWLRDLVSILRDESADPKEFMNLLQIDLYQDEVFVFTPAGDLTQLPMDATPIDFAYAVHTEVGDHCLSAKVDGRIVPLNTKLQSGCTVEIITSDSQSPNYAWLKFVRTSKARNSIRKWQRLIEKEQSMKLGQEILGKTLRKMKLASSIKRIKNSAKELGFIDEENLMFAIGTGQITIRDIVKKILPESVIKDDVELKKKSISFLEKARKAARGVRVHGINNIMMNFSKCCNPIPGDEIIGFVTRGRGITVHRVDCNNLPIAKEDSDRYLDVEWDVGRKEEFLAHIKVVAQDRKGYLKDLTETISSMNINITSVDIKVDEGLATCFLVTSVPHLRKLNAVLTKIKNINGTVEVERAT